MTTIKVEFSPQRLSELNKLAADTLPADKVAISAIELAVLIDGYRPYSMEVAEDDPVEESAVVVTNDVLGQARNVLHQTRFVLNEAKGYIGRVSEERGDGGYTIATSIDDLLEDLMALSGRIGELPEPEMMPNLNRLVALLRQGDKLAEAAERLEENPLANQLPRYRLPVQDAVLAWRDEVAELRKDLGL